MPNRPTTIRALIHQLQQIRDHAEKLEKQFSAQIAETHPAYKESVRNLLHYLALRHKDISQMQNSLGNLGVSRIAKAESHVMASILAVQNMLRYLLEGEALPETVPTDVLKFQEGRQLLQKHSADLLGEQPRQRRVRIMVTLPSQAAVDQELVESFIDNGMNCARINCAHDDATVWQLMIAQVRKVAARKGVSCQVCMDLAGPKLRTGPILPGPKVLKIRPERDLLGQVAAPFRIWLGAEETTAPTPAMPHLHLSAEWLRQLVPGDKLTVEDTRGKSRKLEIVETYPDGCVAEGTKTIYFHTGAEVYLKREGLQSSTKVKELPPVEQAILLEEGDFLVIHREEKPGQAAVYDDQGNLTAAAHISCTLPTIFEDVKEGEPIMLDDGKIEGIIRKVTPEEMEVEITYAKTGGAKLRGDKGINLPKSNLRLKGLTSKDLEDLHFVAAHADVVNMSFVNTPEDVKYLLEELQKLAVKEGFGIILKIETQRAFRNLPALLLMAMRQYPVGVMIARGDLAVECGWDQLAEVQEEILRLCEAAHIPNIWATQVLESMAKKGRPSRAEISDAAMSQRAECVMLNKGPYIHQAIHMLNEILVSMQPHQEKKAPILPILRVPESFKLT